MEHDLSLIVQLLDCLVIRRADLDPNREYLEPLWPDGLLPVAEHNLMSFKSIHEAMDYDALCELAAHWHNYRKQNGPDSKTPLPREQTKMFAICMRYPQKLAERMPLIAAGSGVYNVSWALETIRLIVLSEIPEARNNILWNLFSNNDRLVASAMRRLGDDIKEWGALLNALLELYDLRRNAMPYTVEEFERAAKKNFLTKLTPAERLEGLAPAERLEGLAPEERVVGIPTEVLEQLLRQRKESQNPANTSGSES